MTSLPPRMHFLLSLIQFPLQQEIFHTIFYFPKDQTRSNGRECELGGIVINGGYLGGIIFLVNLQIMKKMRKMM